MTKQQIRKQIKQILSEKTLEQQQAESTLIYKKIISSKEYKNSTTLLAYMPLPDEVDLTPVISDALKCNKTVFLPRIKPGTNQMEFFRYNSQTRISEGSYGITEPEEDITTSYTNWLKKKADEEINKEKILVLVPGRAFTKDGKRLGRGKGFYDIYFSKIDSITKELNLTLDIKKSGVCFSCQLLTELPTTPDDIIMDLIISGE